MTLNQTDYVNLIGLLDRVQVKGIQEIETVAVLLVKLREAAQPKVDVAPAAAQE